MDMSVSYISLLTIPISEQLSGEPSKAPPSRCHRRRSCEVRLSHSFVTGLKLTTPIHRGISTIVKKVISPHYGEV
jgi:hypothetical protein